MGIQVGISTCPSTVHFRTGFWAGRLKCSAIWDFRKLERISRGGKGSKEVELTLICWTLRDAPRYKEADFFEYFDILW